MLTLPAALRPLAASPHWVTWRWVTRAGGRRDKPPFNPRNTEAFASTRRPDSWAGFDLAAAAVARNQADGVGYVLLLDERLIALDLDDCRDPQSGTLEPWAIALVEEADSYTEITPSGTGLRILGLNESIAASLHHTIRKEPGQVEIYHRCPRFITVTGARQPDTPDALRPICDLVGRMLIVAQRREVGCEVFPPRAPNPDAAAPIENITAALAQIPNADLAWDDWSRIGMAVWRASGGSSDGLAAWSRWSAKSRKHVEGACEERWQHWFQSPPSRIGFGTLYHLARAQNPLWVPPTLTGRPAPQPACAPSGTLPAEWDSAPADATSAAEVPEPLWIDADAFDEAMIERRPWIAEGYLLRGAVTVLSGQGAGGKSSLILRLCVALATGQPAGRFRPLIATTVVNYNVEDDLAEQRRRLSAACRAARVPLASTAHRIVRCGPLGVGTLFQRDDSTGLVVPTAAMAQLEALIVRRGASVLVVDPLAELHNVDENDNTAMRAIIATFRSLAQRLKIAVLVIHHDRKGSATPGDMDRARGASALAGAARVMLTLTAMSTEEAGGFGIEPAERRRHFRLDSAKSNYAAPSEAEWWRLEVVQLDNDEVVAAAEPWEPPSPYGDLSLAQCVEILDILARGVEQDGRCYPYAADKRSRDAWAGNVLMRAPFNRTESQSARMLADWQRNGVLQVEASPRPNSGSKRLAYRVDEGRVAEMRRTVDG